MHKRTSTVYKSGLFTIRDGRNCCTLCPQSYAPKTSTTTLARHLKSHHKKEWDAKLNPASAEPLSPSKPEEAMAIAFATHGLPYSLMESPVFRHFLESWPRDRVVNRHQVPDEQQIVAYQMRQDVLLKLRGQVVTLALDGWTNCNHEKVLNLVLLCHGRPAFYWTSFVVDDGQASTMKSVLAPVIAELLEKQLLIAGIVTDNASNMVLLGKRLVEEFPSLHQIPCMAHSLQLVVNDVISEVFAEAVSIQDEWLRLLQSAQYAKSFRRIKNVVGLDHVRLRRPCVTRWNSRWIANKQLLLLRTCISNVLPNTNPDQWRLLERFHNFFEQFTEVTDEIQSDRATVARIWDEVVKLQGNLTKTLQQEDENKRAAASAIVSLQKRITLDQFPEYLRLACLFFTRPNPAAAAVQSRVASWAPGLFQTFNKISKSSLFRSSHRVASTS